MFGNRQRIFLLVIVLAAVAAGVLVTALVSWHNAAMDQQRVHLVGTVRSQANLIDAIARFDRQFSDSDVPGGWFAATLLQLRDAHTKSEGFGETGEFTLARREGDQIVFLLSHRFGDITSPEPLPWSTDLAEPMKRALKGESGVGVGIDYRGVEVLAAYESMAELRVGIVAKIDLAEVRAPYLRAGLVSVVCAVILIILGAFLFLRIADPLVKAVEKSERLYRSVYNCAPLAFVIWDPECRVVGWNEQAEKLFGWTEDEAIGRIFFDLIIPESARPQVEQVVADLLTGELTTHSINENITKDGEIIVCQWNTAALKEADGTVAGAISLGLDVTRRERSEAELKRLTTELVDKNAELEQIIYVASHDLMSPLVNVHGYSGELQYCVEELARCFADSEAPAELEASARPILERDIPEALHFIRSGITKMDTLLSGLLKLCRFGRDSLTIERLDMNTLMKTVSEQFEFQVKEACATVEVDDLPPCRGDATQVNQAFSNLFDNALKYACPERCAHIRITGTTADGWVKYRVSDNGIGIADNQLKTVFEIFHQVDPEANRGDGLGLTIVQRCVSRQGGTLRVESTPGKGSCFELTFPASESGGRT